MKIQIIKTQRGWYWRVVTGNRKVLCHSETYKRKRDAVNAVELVRDYIDAVVIEVVEVVLLPIILSLRKPEIGRGIAISAAP
jgi:uncharacterized protein YegP (UPF0339 family)